MGFNGFPDTGTSPDRPSDELERYELIILWEKMDEENGLGCQMVVEDAKNYLEMIGYRGAAARYIGKTRTFF